MSRVKVIQVSNNAMSLLNKHCYLNKFIQVNGTTISPARKFHFPNNERIQVSKQLIKDWIVKGQRLRSTSYKEFLTVLSQKKEHWSETMKVNRMIADSKLRQTRDIINEKGLPVLLMTNVKLIMRYTAQSFNIAVRLLSDLIEIIKMVINSNEIRIIKDQTMLLSKRVYQSIIQKSKGMKTDSIELDKLKNKPQLFNTFLNEKSEVLNEKPKAIERDFLPTDINKTTPVLEKDKISNFTVPGGTTSKDRSQVAL